MSNAHATAKTKTIHTELIVGSSVTLAPSAQDARAASALLAPQSIRKERILAYHAGVIAAFSQQMGYAFLCGVELNTIKNEIAHGQFEKWCETNLPELQRSTAHNYRAFATLLQEKSKKLSGLVQRLLPAPGEGQTQSSALSPQSLQLDDTDRTEILQAVHDVTDGKTLTQMYRALGVIRDPIHQKDRPHTAPTKLTAEDQAAQDIANTHQLANDARTWRLTASIQKSCDNALLDTLLDELVTTSKHIRDLLKSRRANKKTAPKKGKAK